MKFHPTRFVIRDPKTKKYLRRAKGSGYYGRARKWVDTVEEATSWHKIGHAKNAWLCAVEQKQVKNTSVVICPVMLTCYAPALTIKVESRRRYYRDSGTGERYGYVSGRRVVEVG